MRKVLIVLYYWPPAGGGGVQRWLKFARYLPENGWEPVIYAPENPDYPLIDNSLKDEVPDDLRVVKRPIREPRRLFRKFVGAKGETGDKAAADQLFYTSPSNRSWKQNLSVWVRGNFFIPDARMWWVRPSVRFLNRFLRTEEIDTIVTTGPPHSMHLIGLGLKQTRRSLRWIADFRDPWTFIEYYDKLMLTRWADSLHKKLEKRVLMTADEVVTVSPTWADMLGEIAERKVHVVTNGFDPADFPDHPASLDSQFTICHVGTLALDRNPSNFWEALEAHLETLPDGNQLQMKFVGSTDPAIFRELENRGIPYKDLGYLDHGKAIREMQSAHILLLVVNTEAGRNAAGRIPGKVFEYLAAERPILALCPEDSDVARIVRSCGHQVVDPTKMNSTLLGAVVNNVDSGTRQNQHLRKYTRQYLAREMAEIFSHQKGTA